MYGNNAWKKYIVKIWWEKIYGDGYRWFVIGKSMGSYYSLFNESICFCFMPTGVKIIHLPPTFEVVYKYQ
jgi:hypothetical protein